MTSVFGRHCIAPPRYPTPAVALAAVAPPSGSWRALEQTTVATVPPPRRAPVG